MTTATTSKFENRIRFNWGYNDAAFGVERGLDASNNYGFGPALCTTKPEDVIEQHEDKTYARGWLFGYYEAAGGGTCETSEYAWKSALAFGTVCE